MKKLLAKTCIAAAFSIAASLTWAAEHEVKMLNNGPDGIMAFDPGYLKVAPGDTVHFVPTDAGHNSASTLVPEGATTWQGKLSEKVSVTLDKEGVYIYQCDPHLALGMVGVVQVGEPENLEAATQKAESMSNNMATNKERLGRYMDKVD